ncbi:histone acetylation protein-domain-containing protein [Cokeromyces recurvatus]|uniref:histone acetylation protein-domain-containing protein n=1 Tax=Cokeromyces recurvatus TaxID=90255 RepID=UPI00221FF1DB|nr:histone acetylation protein-domain-containing protein [Cokeromyces recurvatus]KAI7904821.1 histone acetylation protein-domain-containing protein [Cokeromyces recurvatus]
MSFESYLKKAIQDLTLGLTFNVYDIKSNLFHCPKPLIKKHEGETLCRHRLILVSTESEGFLSGLETYEYILSGKDVLKEKYITYISKVDTTTTLKKYQGLTARIVQSYIASLPSSTSVFVFARAQPQYLFAKSAENKLKSTLSDRDLVSWWLSVLNKTPVECDGWWSVPGIDDEGSALIEIGARKRGWKSSELICWQYGVSYKPEDDANLVIPRFEDDAKSRLLKNNKQDKLTITEFWNLLAFGEECGSGKITGFFEIRIKGQNTAMLLEKGQEKLDLKDNEFTLFWNKLMSLDFHDEISILNSTKTALKDLQDMFPNIKPFIAKGVADQPKISNSDSSADKRPAVNMLSSGFIKRKKI